jgi:hypothetical protein
MTNNDYPNWFTTNGASQNFASQLSKFKDVKVDFLQLGAYTGDATNGEIHLDLKVKPSVTES